MSRTAASRSTFAGTAMAAVAAGLLLRAVVGAQSVPTAPHSLTSVVQASNVGLSWSPGSGTGGGVVYQLEVGSSPGAGDLAVTHVAATSVSASGVPDGLYWVRVRTVSASGVSNPSNEISVRVGCTGAPPAPAGLVGQVSGAAIALAWQPSTGASGYVLEAGTVTGAADLGSLPLASTAFGTSAPAGTYYVRVRATNACGTSAPSNEFVVSVGSTPLPPPPGPGAIFGIVDPSILGTCSAATHDRWVVDGGDGYNYRTWHPQTDPTGCVYGHEHGDNPALVQDAEVKSSPVRFGYIGRRHPMPDEPNGHEEAHEGFKVFIANPGEVNDEGRVNRVHSRAVFHMGTGGPKRFTMQMHSAEIRIVHPEFGFKAFTQVMMNTGGTGRVCDPRVQGATKDVVALDYMQVCGRKLGSLYEIWRTEGTVRAPGGKEVYHPFANPAVFDPITVLNPANPSELVYASDPRMTPIKEFNDDWSVNRGCQRESYAQPGYWYNRGGPTTYYTDAMGQPLASSNPLALLQVISAHNSIGAPATTDGQGAFKVRRDYCQQRSRLGRKN